MGGEKHKLVLSSEYGEVRRRLDGSQTDTGRALSCQLSVVETKLRTLRSFKIDEGAA